MFGAVLIVKVFNPIFERKLRRYDYKDLATYLRNATGLPVTPEDMRIWDESRRYNAPLTFYPTNPRLF